MYSYSSSSTFGLFGFISLAIIILYLVAWFLSMQMITSAAEEKGYGEYKGRLWFIGLVGLIFTPAIIVAALPDKEAKKGIADTSPTNIESELPNI